MQQRGTDDPGAGPVAVAVAWESVAYEGGRVAWIGQDLTPYVWVVRNGRGGGRGLEYWRWGKSVTAEVRQAWAQCKVGLRGI